MGENRKWRKSPLPALPRLVIVTVFANWEKTALI
jgi:hypothetical protein